MGRPRKYDAVFYFLEAETLYTASCLARIGLRVYEIGENKNVIDLMQLRIRTTFGIFKRKYMKGESDGFVVIRGKQVSAYKGKRWKELIGIHKDATPNDIPSDKNTPFPIRKDILEGF